MKYSKVLPGAIIYKITRFYHYGDTQFPHLVLARYSKVLPEAVLLLDLHHLLRFYHNIDHWCIKIYHHTNFHIK